MLSSSRGQDIFEDLKGSRPRQGLELRGQGQGLQNVSLKTFSRPVHGMEWNVKWNRTEFSVRNTENARMERNGRFQELNGRQSSILLYQFHTRFRSWHVQRNIYG